MRVPRRYGTITALAAIACAFVLPVMPGCRTPESEAREHLEGEGLKGIELAAVEGDAHAFTYTATLARDNCVGRVSVIREGGNVHIYDDMACRPVPEDCSVDNPHVCFRLGLIEANGDTGFDYTPINHVDATGYFDIACLGGHSRACNALGLEYAEGKGVPVDRGRALAAFERSCSLNHGKGCFNLAVSHHYGRGVPVNETRAVTLYQKACSLRSRAACYNLGVCLRDGVGAPRAAEQAAESFRKACRKDHLLACVNLGVMYATGDGIAVNEKQARKLFRYACEHGARDGCEGLERLP